jgi:hypothetical protein
VNAYRDPKELKKLVQIAHRVLFGTTSVQVDSSERAAFVRAFSRASRDIPDAWDTKNKDSLCEAIAHLIIAIGHAY